MQKITITIDSGTIKAEQEGYISALELLGIYRYLEKLLFIKIYNHANKKPAKK
jgi:hypothetical protein